MEIWKKRYELLLVIYKVTSKYPNKERVNLISKSRSAANSIVAQIADAHGRFSFADRVKVLYQGRSEIEEVKSRLKRSL